MIDIRTELKKWLEDNVDVQDTTWTFKINDDWYNQKRKSEAQVTLLLVTESERVSGEIDYPNGGFEFMETWELHIFSPNREQRRRITTGVLRTFRNINWEEQSDEESVFYEVILATSPRYLDKSEDNTRRTSKGETEYLWENYRSIITMNCIYKIK